jgi:hypothetical protein
MSLATCLVVVLFGFVCYMRPRHDLAPKITQIGYPYRLNNARHTEPVPHAVHARLRQATLHAPQQLHNRSEDQRLQGAEPSHKAATMAHWQPGTASPCG